MQDRPEEPSSQAQPQPQPLPPAQAQQPLPAPRPEPTPGPASGPTPGPIPGPTPTGSYGPPPTHPPTQQYAYGQPPGFPPPSGGKGTAGRAVLWAAVGAVAASVVWAGGIVVLGPLGDDPDLAGYRAKANLCSAVDYSALRTEYSEEDSSPTHNSLKHKAIDQSYCSISLKTSSSSSYADAYLSVEMDLHKSTDPAPEFTAVWSEYGQRYEDYEVEEVSGFGDEAYLVTEDTTSGTGTSGSRAVTLAVRDGWMTYQMSWSAYTTSYGSTTPPEVSEVSRWLRTDTRSTLENLRSD
ncbi:hypothetical protein ACFXAW_01465 [Streptomyces sp. NPDC059445]|uniref:hypothetical protein n=1 Tax=unclassified Streptomyces TaxID=2593676 RepID=UPI0036B00F76